jgi:hypothetical protein
MLAMFVILKRKIVSHKILGTCLQREWKKIVAGHED